MALYRLIPPFVSNSTILSNADESEPFSLTSSLKLEIFGKSGLENFDDRALTQFLLPLIALISPLCASNLNG